MDRRPTTIIREGSSVPWACLPLLQGANYTNEGSRYNRAYLIAIGWIFSFLDPFGDGLEFVPGKRRRGAVSHRSGHFRQRVPGIGGRGSNDEFESLIAPELPIFVGRLATNPGPRGFLLYGLRHCRGGSEWRALCEVHLDIVY